MLSLSHPCSLSRSLSLPSSLRSTSLFHKIEGVELGGEWGESALPKPCYGPSAAEAASTSHSTGEPPSAGPSGDTEWGHATGSRGGLTLSSPERGEDSDPALLPDLSAFRPYFEPTLRPVDVCKGV